MKKLPIQILYLVLFALSLGLVFFATIPTNNAPASSQSLPFLFKVIAATVGSVLFPLTYTYRLVLSNKLNRVINILNYVFYGLILAIFVFAMVFSFQGRSIQSFDPHRYGMIAAFAGIIAAMIFQIVYLKKRAKN